MKLPWTFLTSETSDMDAINDILAYVYVCVCIYTLTGMHGPAELLTSRWAFL